MSGKYVHKLQITAVNTNTVDLQMRIQACISRACKVDVTSANDADVENGHYNVRIWADSDMSGDHWNRLVHHCGASLQHRTSCKAE